MISPVNPSQGGSGIKPLQPDTAGSSKSTDKAHKLNTIRDQIRNGSYTVNFESLASALIKSGQASR